MNNRMITLALAAVSTAAALTASAQEKKDLKVLMVGNSFSICVLKEMPAIAASMGCGLDLASLYIGGCQLDRHVKNLSATNCPYDVRWNYHGNTGRDAVPFAAKLVEKKWPQGHVDTIGNLRDVLAGDRWDVVTIQQASHASWLWETYQPYADTLIAAIREHAPQAEIVIQQTWSYCKADSRICNPKTGGAGTWKVDQDEMFQLLSANYLRLARQNGLRIIPTGQAIQNYRHGGDGVAKFGDVVGGKGDSIHLNSRGHYLQGLVWTAALFGADVAGCPYAPKGVDPADAALMRQAAAAAVRR